MDSMSLDDIKDPVMRLQVHYPYVSILTMGGETTIYLPGDGDREPITRTASTEEEAAAQVLFAIAMAKYKTEKTSPESGTE